MTKVDGRGKAPKAGKGVGRKRLAPELKKEETKTVSIRLPVSSIKFHGIDGAWLFDAAMQKISATTGLNYMQPYDPEYKPATNAHADLRVQLIDLLSAEMEGELCYKDELCYEIAGILKKMGVL
mgnify:FL=1